MPILDTTKRPQVVDRDELVFIGIDLPFRKSDGPEGWFAQRGYSQHLQHVHPGLIDAFKFLGRIMAAEP